LNLSISTISAALPRLPRVSITEIKNFTYQ